MALNPKTAVASRNAALNAVGVLLNGGTCKVYDGSQPADADTAITTQTLSVTATFGSPAFAAANAGSMSANSITGGTIADSPGATDVGLGSGAGAERSDAELARSIRSFESCALRKGRSRVCGGVRADARTDSGVGSSESEEEGRPLIVICGSLITITGP